MRALRTLAPAVAVLTALTLAGCGSSGKDDPEAAATPTATASEAPDDEDIEVEFADPSTEPGEAGSVIGALAARDSVGAEELAKVILVAGEVDGIAKRFSREFIIPEELRIQVVSGDEGPNYNPDTRTITLSYGFANLTGEIIAASQPDLSEEQFGAAWAAVNDFILIHELAHSFVDVLDIPVTGREEDAADGMATYFFTDAVDGGAEYAFSAAQFFAALQDVQGQPDATQYADEHSLSIQRAVDIACKVAGSSEANLQEIASREVMPVARLQRCPDEYEQMANAWQALLKPHVQESSDEASPSPTPSG